MKEAAGGANCGSRGRETEEELLAPGGGAMRRALVRLPESSLLPPVFSFSAFLWRSSLLRNVGSPVSQAQSRSHSSSENVILPY